MPISRWVFIARCQERGALGCHTWDTDIRNAVEARKLEHDRPPTTHQSTEENQCKSSYINVPTFFGVYYCSSYPEHQHPWKTKYAKDFRLDDQISYVLSCLGIHMDMRFMLILIRIPSIEPKRNYIRSFRWESPQMRGLQYRP